MKFWRSYKRTIALSSGVAAMLWPGLASAASQFTVSKYGYTFEIKDIASDLELPLTDTVESIAMPLELMQERLAKASTDTTIEPLTLVIGPRSEQIASLAAKLAKPSKNAKLKAYFKKKLAEAPAAHLGNEGNEGGARTVTLDQAGFNLVDPVKLGALFAKPQHNLVIQGDAMRRDQRLVKNFMRELVPYFDKASRSNLKQKLNSGESLEVNTELLPEFARSMLKKYIIYRGPNCFHAALAFQSVILPSSSFINVKEEPGYHRAMINYDELWRTIGAGFYEVDPTRQPLKYGDMLVFFDVPEKHADQALTEVDFHWIRHTATHLFNGFTFSKGSKSPNTPYTVRTLTEEWDTWKKFTRNLGLKVYRRSLTKVAEKPAVDLVDWVY